MAKLTPQEAGKLYGGRLPKFDYDGDAFYDEVFALALQGQSNAQIAANLADKFGESLDDKTFSAMINGIYIGWSKEENARRSARLLDRLTHAREKLNGVVRASYLKGALGGKRTTSRVSAYLKTRCLCEGQDPDCPECGGIGWIYSKKHAIVQETETELPPNMQALGTWLSVHDKEWREMKEQYKIELSGQVQTDAPRVKVEMVYVDTKDLEIQETRPQDFAGNDNNDKKAEQS